MAFYLLALVAAVSPSLSLYAGLALAPVLLVAALLPAITLLRTQGYRNYLKQPYVWALGAFLAYAIISSFWAIIPANSMDAWWRIALIALMGFGVCNNISHMPENQRQTLGTILLYGYGLALVLANIDIYGNGLITRHLHFYQAVYKYELTDLNRGATYLSVLLCPVAAILWQQRRFKFLALAIVLALATILQLDSLSAAMGVVAAIMTFAITYGLRRKAIWLIMAAFIITGIAAPAFFYKTDVHKLVKTIPVIPGAASEYRLYIWSFAAKRAGEKPLLGWGLNSARSIPVHEEDYVQEHRYPLPLHPHDNLIQIWLELGIVGLLLYAGIVLAMLKTLLNNAMPRDTRAFYAASFVCYFTIGLTAFGIWQYWWLSAGVLGLGYLHTSLKRQA